MRWPRLMRRSRHAAGSPHSLHGYLPGSWGQTAAPVAPAVDTGPSSAPTGDVEVAPAPADSLPQAQVPLPLVAPPATETTDPVASDPEDPTPPSGVRLGFSDGSDVQLDENHPHSLALKAVADVLLQRGSHRRVS